MFYASSTLMAACGRGATPITASFELVRGGALRAYAAAREALELRTRPAEDLLPFDAEDASLTGLWRAQREEVNGTPPAGG